MAGDVEQVVLNSSNTAYVDISTTAGNALCGTVGTSAGGGTPTITAVQAMSGTGGTGSVLATGVVPASPLNTREIAAGAWESGFYIENLPSGVQSVLFTFNGGPPGTIGITAVETSGVAVSSSYLAGAYQLQTNPGTGTDAITSGTASVGSIPALIIGIKGGWAETTGVAGTGFTQAYGPANYTSVGFRRETGSTGSYAATFTDATNGASTVTSTTMMAFAEAVAGPTSLGAKRIPLFGVG
jgi:hypothetical protein